ncbi:MAG: TadE/TadG family type IV pilus assembly protein [bacterium]
MELEPTAAEVSHSRLKRMIRRFRKTETGQALVEFTMILPIFLLLLFAMVDFGRGFYTWLIVTNAAREGARIAAVQSNDATINTRIYDSFCTSYPGNCSLNPTKLTITKTNVLGARGSAVKIDLSYNFQFVTPIGGILNIVSGGSLATPVIKAHSSMRLE